MAFPPKIPEADLPSIIARYRDGHKLVDLATQYGCTDKALYQRIRLYCDSGKGDASYKDLVTDMYVMRQLECEEKLADAPDMLEFARSREQLKCAQWHLERRTKLYAPKQEVAKEDKIIIIPYREMVQTLDISPNYVKEDRTQITDASVSDWKDKDNEDRV